jgi:hypothetical protein
MIGLMTLSPASGASQGHTGAPFSLRGLRAVAIDFSDLSGRVDLDLQRRVTQAAVTRLEQAGLRVVAGNQAPNATSVLAVTIEPTSVSPRSINARLQLKTPMRSDVPGTVDLLTAWYYDELANGSVIQESGSLVNRLIDRFISAWQQANQ